MNMFKNNEEERARRDAQAAARNAEILKSRVAAATLLEAELSDFLRSGFPSILVSRSQEVLTLQRVDGMKLIISVMDNGMFSLEYPGATDAMARHRKNFGCFVLEKAMTAKVVDWLNGKS